MKSVPREPLDVDIIISTDRCLISDHHGHAFIGFAATGPAVLLPEKVWKWIACPRPKVDKHGRPQVAPYGLRKIEAALQDAGFKAHVIDPDYVPYYARRSLALFIGHHDYFAFGPPSSEWWMITDREPVNRKSFIKFISNPVIWEEKARRGFKVVVGGPAVWQWDVWPEARRRWPVDTLVEGEAEKVVVKLAEAILNGDPLPEKIVVKPGEEPGVDEIPIIKAPSSAGIVEIMRGCPRGCKFCSVTLKPLRFIPLEKIEEEIKVNLNGGSRNIVLHSEDVLLYKADVIRPRPEPLIKLHEMVAKYLNEYEAGFAWSHASLAAIKYAEEHGRVISKISDLVLDGDVRPFFGVEVGLETGSVRLARKIMPAKAAPYRAEEYPRIVEEAFAIMADNNIIPAATFILGLPGEKEEDVYDTIELIERLKHYPSLIVPMFFVPMGILKKEKPFTRDMIKDYHIDALIAAARHTIRWAKWILEHGYLKGFYAAPVRYLLRIAVNLAEKKLNNYLESYKQVHVKAAASIAG